MELLEVPQEDILQGDRGFSLDIFAKTFRNWFGRLVTILWVRKIKFPQFPYVQPWQKSDDTNLAILEVCFLLCYKSNLVDRIAYN